MSQNIFSKQKGFTLLELVLAVAIFAISAITTGFLIIDAMTTTDANNKKIQATFFAKEGIEAVRMIRTTEGYSALVNGNHGLDFDEDIDTWGFVGAPDIQEDIFERTITISDYANGKLVRSTVSVPVFTRNISVTLETLFTDWTNY